MNYLRVTKENASDFSSVLPERFCTGRDVSLAAYEDDGAVCGAVSVTYGDNQYDVNWLYVVPEKRRQYVASGLIREIKSMVNVIGIYPIRAEFEISDDNGLYGLFLSVSDPDFPVELDYSYDRYYVTAEDLLSSEVMKKFKMFSDTPIPIWNMEESFRNSVMDIAMEHLAVTDPETFEESCEKKLCLAVMEDNEILSFMLTQVDQNRNLKLSYLYSKAPAALMSMLFRSSQWLKKDYRKAQITFDPVTKEAEKLAHKIFPNAETRAVYEAEF